MTCRPDQSPPKDFAGDEFVTCCYKCGRKMVFVRGERLIPAVLQGEQTKVWRKDWILDQEVWTHRFWMNTYTDEQKKADPTLDSIKWEKEPSTTGKG